MLCLQAMRDKFDEENKANGTEASPEPGHTAASNFQRRAAQQGSSAREWFKKASAESAGSGGGSSSSGDGASNDSTTAAGNGTGQGGKGPKSDSSGRGGGSSSGNAAKTYLKPESGVLKSTGTKAVSKPFIGPARPSSGK
jgi:hypothetical protein